MVFVVFAHRLIQISDLDYLTSIIWPLLNRSSLIVVWKQSFFKSLSGFNWITSNPIWKELVYRRICLATSYAITCYIVLQCRISHNRLLSHTFFHKYHHLLIFFLSSPYHLLIFSLSHPYILFITSLSSLLIFSLSYHYQMSLRCLQSYKFDDNLLDSYNQFAHHG